MSIAICGTGELTAGCFSRCHQATARVEENRVISQAAVGRWKTAAPAIQKITVDLKLV